MAPVTRSLSLIVRTMQLNAKVIARSEKKIKKNKNRAIIKHRSSRSRGNIRQRVCHSAREKMVGTKVRMPFRVRAKLLKFSAIWCRTLVFHTTYTLCSVIIVSVRDRFFDESM